MSLLTLSPKQSFLSSNTVNQSISNKVILKTNIPIDPPTLKRFYLGSIQSVPLSIKSLNSKATYLYLSDEEKLVFGWFGSESSLEDRKLAYKIGLDILSKEYHQNITEFPIIIENIEILIQLRYFLEKLYENNEQNYKNYDKNYIINNSNITIYSAEKINLYNNSIKYLLKEISTTTPDENGRIPRLNFPDITNKLCLCINTENYWDLWITKDMTNELNDILLFLSDYIINNSTNKFDGLINSSNINVIIQGNERILFKQKFKILSNFDSNYNLINNLNITNKRNSMTDSELDAPNSILKNNKYNIKNNKKINFDDNFSDNTSNLSFTVNEKIKIIDKSNGLPKDKPKILKEKESESSEKLNESVEKSNIEKISKNKQKKSINNQITKTPVITLTSEELKLISLDKKKNPGKYLLNPDMMKEYDNLNISPKERLMLLQKSLDNPAILVGWQIEIDYGYQVGIAIITDYKKPTFLSKLDYRLSRINTEPYLDNYSPLFDDVWVNLKRSSEMKGISFRLLRKVFDVTLNV